MRGRKEAGGRGGDTEAHTRTHTHAHARTRTRKRTRKRTLTQAQAQAHVTHTQMHTQMHAIKQTHSWVSANLSPPPPTPPRRRPARAAPTMGSGIYPIYLAKSDSLCGRDILYIYIYIYVYNISSFVRGPEAGDGEEVVADGDEEVVLVGHVLIVVTEEELRESFHLHARKDRRTLSSLLRTSSIGIN